ncbi:hypothetical protein BSKO_01602 [Bryopsis sp. KO-2023]|nr:hypothetical protein BSKO_01602 [Bryopsis sp. KO-2023]
MSELATLRTAKAALDEGLITQADFNSVKEGFLNAQRIKAGLDAGFIPEEDFAQASAAFFESLGVSPQTASSGAQQARKPAQASTQQRKVQNGAPLGRPAAGTTATSGAAFGRPVAGTTATAGAVFGRPAAGSTTTTQSTPSARPKPAAQSGGGGGQGSTWKPKPSSAAPQAVNLARNSLTKPVVPSSAVSMAGIAVDENAIAEFNLMRVKSKYLWMLFKIDDSGRTVVLCDSGDKSSNYQDFVGRFPQNECRYGVFDYPYETSEGRKLQKLVFFNWAPDTAPVKDKMMASSTKDFVKTQMSGVQVEVQATDHDELHDDEVSKAVGATLTRG